jgi:hypothetical protein
MNTAPLANELEEAVADMIAAARKVASLTTGVITQNKVAVEYLRHGRLTRDTERLIERQQATNR